jgi:cyclophilin family peptidyl-prolyl cis-trans isomerase/HEAT repeat protein
LILKGGLPVRLFCFEMRASSTIQVTLSNRTMRIRNTIAASLLLLATFTVANAQKASVSNSSTIPQQTLLQIIRAEDERRWNENLKSLLSNEVPRVRKRAALAAGRIGDPNAVPVLTDMVLMDRDADVRQMAAFALGEIEAPGGAFALVSVLKEPTNPGRARAIEALGKIIAAMPANASATPNQNSAKEPADERRDILTAAVLDALRFEDGRGSQADRQTILLGLTAVLRVRPEGTVGKFLVKFLDYSDAEIVATALNTMARLRLKEGNERVRQLLNHNDPIVRANAARLIGAAEHKEAFDEVLARALNDSDLRVRAAAIRTLASLKDARAVEPLVKRGNSLINSQGPSQSARNELLEIATTLGRLLTHNNHDGAIRFLDQMHSLTKGEAVEVEVAFARVAPATYQNDPYRQEASRANATWRRLSRRAQGLAAIGESVTAGTSGSSDQIALKLSYEELAAMLQRATTPHLAIPDILQAYAGYKRADADQIARKYLQADDVVIRSTAAEVIGGQAPNETNMRALIAALPRALRDEDLDDAALAILGALAKQKSTAANDAIKTALDSDTYLIRRRAVALLKANGVGDFSDRIGSIKTKNTDVDYRRAINRIGKKVTATIVTTRGSFTIEFLPEDAPLTVDNFVQLARRGYFQGQTIPRVVPNFVIQAGDPRGDQNGGPGYQIRCEINEVSYERASLGMALSGKDTGGSQWFVTHSPQPHLDGGYTVFGRVIRGMEVVDKVARGDTIRRVVINER